MSRAQLVALARNQVALTFTDGDGAPCERTFYARAGGGYVREIVADGRERPQVCSGLYSTGETLYWSGRRPLVDLIQAEWRAHARQERKLS